MNTIEILENSANLQFHRIKSGLATYPDTAKPMYYYTVETRARDGYELQSRLDDDPLYLVISNPRYLDPQLDEISTFEKLKYRVFEILVEPTDEGDIVHLTVGHDGNLQSLRF